MLTYNKHTARNIKFPVSAFLNFNVLSKPKAFRRWTNLNRNELNLNWVQIFSYFVTHGCNSLELVYKYECVCLCVCLSGTNVFTSLCVFSYTYIYASFRTYEIEKILKLDGNRNW